MSTTGNKNDLVERLQNAIKSSKMDDAATTESVDDLDEDLLNVNLTSKPFPCLMCAFQDDLDEHLDNSVIQELDSAIEATSQNEKGEKRKLEVTAVKSNAPKKVVLNRNPSVSSDTQNGNATAEIVEERKDDENPEKKIIKLSELSVKEVPITNNTALGLILI